MTDKQQILVPITCIAKLILLQFKSDDTKLSFRNYSMHYDDPFDKPFYLIQSIERRFRGDNREDVSILNSAIINYIEWYIINPDMKNNKKMHDIFKQLLALSVKGLIKLKNTYIKCSNKTCCVILTLQYYINIINNVLINDNIKFIEHIPTKNTPNEDNNLINMNSVQKIWNDEEINEMYNDIMYCFDEDLNVKCVNTCFIKSKIKGLYNILMIKDDNFTELIKLSLANS